MGDTTTRKQGIISKAGSSNLEKRQEKLREFHKRRNQYYKLRAKSPIKVSE
jgi:hypothetical protein